MSLFLISVSRLTCFYDEQYRPNSGFLRGRTYRISDKCFYFLTLTKKNTKTKDHSNNKMQKKAKENQNEPNNNQKPNQRQTNLRFHCKFFTITRKLKSSPRFKSEAELRTRTHHRCSGRPAGRVCRRSGTASCRSPLSAAWFCKESVWKTGIWGRWRRKPKLFLADFSSNKEWKKFLASFFSIFLSFHFRFSFFRWNAVFFI